MKRLKEGKTIDGCRFKYGKKQQNGRRLKFWSIKHTLDGKQINEGLGNITQATALDISRQLRENKAYNKLNAGKGRELLPETYKDMKYEAAREKRLEIANANAEAIKNITFEEFFAEFVTKRDDGGRPKDEISRYRSRYKKWIHKEIGHTRASKICDFDLQRIVAKMDKAGAAPSTIIKVIGIISHAYSSSGKYKNPVVRKRVFEMRPDIKDAATNNKRIRYLTPDEARQLLKALPEQLSIMAMLSMSCGFRASELFRMKWGDIDFENMRIHVPETKNGEARTVSMGQSAADKLQSLPPGRRNQLVFPSPKGVQHKEIPGAFRDTVKKLCFNEDVDDARNKVVFHSLRHTCGSWMVDNGIDLFTVQKVLGHKSIATTQRYVHSTGQLVAASKIFDNKMQEPGLQLVGEEVANG